MWSECGQPLSQAQCQSWYSKVAARLLQDRLLLTALELHTELVEAGREEPQLREFFSNPANFERPPTDTIVRCPSQATLDSLDLTRLSEDSERSDDVAVLEFELRKAKETIHALRANLTQVTECDSSSVDVGYEKILNEDSIKPHERRALNFLIYEYLLQQDCKLTSITFSDEVPEQDFECWDDVGLNVPRPAGLISMYRGETANQSTKSNCHEETQTEELALSESNSTYLIYPESKSAVDSVNSFTDQNEEIAYLKKQVLALETDKVNYQKLYDAALASLNSLTSPTSDIPSSETTLYNREDNSVEMLQSVDMGTNYTCEIENIDDELQPLPQNATQNYYGSSVSTNSLTPDQFEMIDSDKNGGSSQKDGSNVSSFEPAVMVEDHMVCSPKSLHEPKRNESETTLDDTMSFNDHIENDWEREQIMRTMKSLTDESFNTEGKNEAWINSDLPNEYKSILMKFCDIQYSSDGAFLKDIPHANQPIGIQQYLNVVSVALPKIIPNILLVKRDEVIPLLICTIFLQPQQSQRDKLLQLLLNLRKKMEKDDRTLIISGLVLLLQWNIESNSGIDSDLLGFFWEMLNSKSPEKRILGAEASVALAPYISLELVNSLLLSMVLSMCDSGDVAIRKQGLSGAIMICPTANLTKYSQIEGVFFTLAFDTDASISEKCIETFAPVLARTALLNGIFHTELCPHLLERLSDLIADGEQSVVVLKILNNVVLFSLLYVVDVDTVRDRLSATTYDSTVTQKLAEYLYERPFHDLKYLMTDDSIDPFKLIQAFYEMTETDVDSTWYERDWLINNWLNKILYLLITYRNPINVQTVHALVDFFNTWNVVFGDKFTKSFIRHMMESELNKIEQNIIKPEYRNQFSPILISVYLGTITANSDDDENIRNTIKRWCICCGLCSIPSVIIGIPLVIYSNKEPTVFNIALAAIWQCIVHSNEQVRAYTAALFDYLVQWGSLTEEVMNSSIIPGIVTLVSDSAIAVKCNAINSLGSIVCRTDLYPTILDKCWHTLESLAIEEKTNGGLGSFTTICLAKTFHKIVKNDNPTCQNRVLQNLATLCYSPIYNSGNVSSINGLLEELLSALQLATHKKICDQFIQTVLLPALKRLESLDGILSWEYKCTIKSLIHKITSSEVQIKEHPSNAGQQQHGASIAGHTLPSLLANSESVGRRVTQMFQYSKQSKPAMNLQNIFKKK